MFIVVTYDIDQEDGGKRLRKVAKICESYGVRVQNSVFEMNLTGADLITLQKRLRDTIDVTCDTIRIYKLGKIEKADIIMIGLVRKVELTMNDTIIL